MKTPDSIWRTDREIAEFVGTSLRGAIRSTPPLAGGRRQVLFFIHGFNTSFERAIRKTGQLAGDLDLVSCRGEMKGTAVAYCWPSDGSLLGYLADEEMAEWTQQRLVPFLEALSTVCRQENAELQIFAHSMGARALIRSLSDVARSSPGRLPSGRLADQLVLLAPDISKDLFDQYVERVLPLVGHLTIYVSAKDRALALSTILHGGHHRLGLIESTVSAALQLSGLTSQQHQLGEFSPNMVASGKIDMIDVTGSLANAIGHSYEDPAFVRDVRELIFHHTPAGQGARSNLAPQNVRPTLFGLFGNEVRLFHLTKSAP